MMEMIVTYAPAAVITLVSKRAVGGICRKGVPNMDRKRLKVVLGIVAIALAVALPASAQCPEGKSEILIVTPSGRDKVRCVPDQALPGIENAADHSAGTVLPADCPCFTAEDLAARNADPGLACIGGETAIDCDVSASDPDPKTACEPAPCAPPCISMADFAASHISAESFRCESLANAILAYPAGKSGEPTCPTERLNYCKAANGGECQCAVLSSAEATACLLLLQPYLDLTCTP